MEQEEILKQAAEIIKAQNEEKMKAFNSELSELCDKYGINLVPTIQIQVR